MSLRSAEYSTEVPQQVWIQGDAEDARDGDLRVWTRVDVVPVVCKQGVRGSSRLSFTGQKPNSKSRAHTSGPVQQQSTATGTARDTAHAFDLGLALAGGGAQIPGLGAEFRATEQEERLWEGPVPLAPRPAGNVPNLPFQGWFLPLMQRVSE